MDTLSDKLQTQVLGNLSDLKDFRNCRLVSQKWKRNVMEACRNKFHVVFPLTDSTLHTANKLKNAPVSFDIFAFTGKEPKDVWQQSGIEPLMQTTESLQFTGNEVCISEIRKFLGLARTSLKMLSLRSVNKNLACPFLEMQENFSALRKVSLGYYKNNSGTDIDLFSIYTDTLEKWIRLDCRVQLPVLESLSLCFTGNLIRKDWNRNSKEAALGKMFRNYVAIAKLMLKYKQTLREVQIERHFEMHVHRCEGYTLPEWAEMQRGLEALDDLNLTRIKVSKSQNHMFCGEKSLKTGIEMSSSPKDLKKFLFNNLMLPFRSNWGLLMATLSKLRNMDVSHLTSINISLMLGDLPDPTMVVNLGSLRNCNNLRTVYLNLTMSDSATELVVRNLELLPKGISTLHFENIEDERYRIGREILLSQQQMRWIIDNLRNLESFRTSLVIPERANANNNEQREVAGAGAGGNNAQRQQQQERINRLVNINLDTFGDLLAMPKLKNLKLDMTTGRALNIAAGLNHPWNVVRGEGTTLEDVREYSDLCQPAGYTAATTTSKPTFRWSFPRNLDFGVNHIFGYATLAIKKN